VSSFAVWRRGTAPFALCAFTLPAIPITNRPQIDNLPYNPVRLPAWPCGTSTRCSATNHVCNSLVRIASRRLRPGHQIVLHQYASYWGFGQTRFPSQSDQQLAACC
jgi:hypothetical protein